MEHQHLQHIKGPDPARMAFRVSAFKIRQVILCRSIGEVIGLSAQAVFGERGSTLKCVQVINLQLEHEKEAV